jgi:hypothetical protein
MSQGPIYSRCGYNCGKCPAYKANSVTEDDRKRGSEAWAKYFGLHFSPSIIKCEGCRSAEPWKTGNLLPDRMCAIRACANYNGVPNCAYCSIFPCPEYTAKISGPDLRRQREEASNIMFSEAEYQQYLEPFEGQTHLKELHKSIQPEELIAPKPVEPMTVISPFPMKSGPGTEEESRFRTLHRLLSKVFLQKASSFSGQTLLERKNVYIRGLLWVLGYYGKMENDRLTITSGEHGNFKECNRLVRKTDNQLHGAIQQAAESIAQFGIKVEFKPQKKAWEIGLLIEPKAGGGEALTALHEYNLRMAEKHGVPVYVDSMNLKGKAFKLFSQLDMNGI